MPMQTQTSQGILIPKHQFKYAGKMFQLVVSIGTADDILLPVDFEDNKKYQALANQNIESLEFTNALNQLCMTGSLVYTDVEGYVTDFLNRTNVEVVVDLKQILTTADGTISIKNVDTANTIYHVFLVDNIQILSRDGGVLKYKLSLVSKHFNAMAKTLFYSNYAREPERITDILKALMKRAADGFGDKPLFKLAKKFEDDESASAVKLHYTTNGNDNMLTVTKFLLSRMFYFQQKSQETRDESVKMLYYDSHENEYGLLDLAKTDITKASADKLILSMFKTPEELLAYGEECQIATVESFPQTKYKKLVFGTHTFDYELLHNTISQEYVSQKQLTEYHDKTDSQNLSQVEPQTQPKDNPKNTDYANMHAYWSNTYAVYANMVDSLLGTNALVVSTAPTIHRMPSNAMFVTIPPDKTNNTADSQMQYESVAGRYGQMQGEWLIGKVRNMLFPSKSMYKQNLVLFKNFLTKKEVVN